MPVLLLSNFVQCLATCTSTPMKVAGFIEIGSDLVKGDVIIPQTIFEDPAGEPEKE